MTSALGFTFAPAYGGRSKVLQCLGGYLLYLHSKMTASISISSFPFKQVPWHTVVETYIPYLFFHHEMTREYRTLYLIFTLFIYFLFSNLPWFFIMLTCLLSFVTLLNHGKSTFFPFNLSFYERFIWWKIAESMNKHHKLMRSIKPLSNIVMQSIQQQRIRGLSWDSD